MIPEREALALLRVLIAQFPGLLGTDEDVDGAELIEAITYLLARRPALLELLGGLP